MKLRALASSTVLLSTLAACSQSTEKPDDAVNVEIAGVESGCDSSREACEEICKGATGETLSTSRAKILAFVETHGTDSLDSYSYGACGSIQPKAAAYTECEEYWEFRWWARLLCL